MNKIELSIINGLNASNGVHGNWKLFANRKVSNTMKLNEKETKVYNALECFLTENALVTTVLPITKFTTMFVDFSNEKLIELPSVLVDVKTIEKCLKFYFLNNHLNLNRYFCLCMNENDDKIYIASVCRESGIYVISEKKASDENDDDNTTENENNDAEILLKISTLLNSVYSLAKDLDDNTKENITKEFIQSMGIKKDIEIIKNSAIV